MGRATTCHSGCPASVTCWRSRRLSAITAVAAMVMRRWRVAAFIVAAIAVEAATYRVATWVIHRQRPNVPRLDDLPADASYYSGHTAASIAVYCGIALLITSRVRSGWIRVAVWTIAIAIPALVAFSRMYRGMHHPTDVAAARPGRHRVAARGDRRGACRRRRRPVAEGRRMTRVAVVAHAGKSIEGGLPQLRRTLAEHGVDDPLWAEVDKSRRAPKQIKRLLGEGADLFFVWGGDGMAQRSVDVLAGTDAAMAIVPAGTANLLATNLGVPGDIEGAVTTGLRGRGGRSTRSG